MGCFGRSPKPTSPITNQSNTSHSPRGRKRAHKAQEEQEVSDSEVDSDVERAVAPLSRKKSFPEVVMTQRGSPVRSSTQDAVKPKSSLVKSNPRVIKPRSNSAKLKATSPKPCPKPVSMDSAASRLTDPARADKGDTVSKPTTVSKDRKRRKVV